MSIRDHSIPFWGFQSVASPFRNAKNWARSQVLADSVPSFAAAARCPDSKSCFAASLTSFHRCRPSSGSVWFKVWPLPENLWVGSAAIGPKNAVFQGRFQGFERLTMWDIQLRKRPPRRARSLCHPKPRTADLGTNCNQQMPQNQAGNANPIAIAFVPMPQETPLPLLPAPIPPTNSSEDPI